MMVVHLLRICLLVLSPVARSQSEGTITVVSYNLYWWNVQQNNRWEDLYQKIKEHPADLYGFQECENVEQVMERSGLGKAQYGFFQGPNKPNANPAPLVWSKEKFDLLPHGTSGKAEPQTVWIAADGYGDRNANVVRLRHKASGKTVVFSNTHGPLGNCGGTTGDNWVKSITNSRKDNDVGIMTGDFNCWPGTDAMNRVTGLLKKRVPDGSIDFVLTTSSSISGGKHDKWPSDHDLVKAQVNLCAAPAATDPCEMMAGGHTCGARIEWLNGQGMSMADARQQIEEEFPNECKSCTSGDLKTDAVNGGSCNSNDSGDEGSGNDGSGDQGSEDDVHGDGDGIVVEPDFVSRSQTVGTLLPLLFALASALFLCSQ
jgi:endonuclease/exonuclease/phosphatase family metal-dependent hydrolase